MQKKFKNLLFSLSTPEKDRFVKFANGFTNTSIILPTVSNEEAGTAHCFKCGRRNCSESGKRSCGLLIYANGVAEPQVL